MLARQIRRVRAERIRAEHGTAASLVVVGVLVAGFAGYCSGAEPGAAKPDKIMPMIDLSVVIPVRNEAASLDELHGELSSTLRAWGRSYELIVIDDGSTDESFETPRAAPGGRSAPDASSASAGTSARRRRSRRDSTTRAAGIIVTVRRRPAERSARHPGDGRGCSSAALDIVCGWRKNRQRRLSSRGRLPSMIANGLISFVTGVHLHDYGCSLKAFRAEVVKTHEAVRRDAPIPACDRERADCRISSSASSIIIRRKHGRSSYGIGRTIRVVLDLLTVKFLLSYSTRPLHIFGLIGGAMGLAGLALTGWLAFGA